MNDIDFDEAGRPTNLTLTSSITTTFSYNPWSVQGGRLLNKTTNYGTALQNFSYTYDSLGNITQFNNQTNSEVKNYQYDSLNRILGMSGAETATYVYDVKGNLGASFVDSFDTKDVNQWSWSTETVPYVDSGNNVVKSDGTGNNFNTNFYSKTYSLITGLTVQLRFKVNNLDTTSHYAIETSNGKRYAILVYQGAIRVQYSLDGVNFPNIILIANPQTDIWYVGQIILDYLNRWVQPDNIIPDIYNPLDLDRYSYVRNNPVNFNDPTGHCIGPLVIICIMAAGGIIYKAAATVVNMANGDSYEQAVARTTPDQEVQAALIVGGGFIAVYALPEVVAAVKTTVTNKFTTDPSGALTKLINGADLGSEESINTIKQITDDATRGVRVQGGTTIIGSFPEYTKAGNVFFNLDPKVYDTLLKSGDVGKAIIRSVNQRFLVDSIAAGNIFKITLGVGKNPGPDLTWEIAYLLDHGYKWLDGIVNGTLVPINQ